VKQHALPRPRNSLGALPWRYKPRVRVRHSSCRHFLNNVSRTRKTTQSSLGYLCLVGRRLSTLPCVRLPVTYPGAKPAAPTSLLKHERVLDIFSILKHSYSSMLQPFCSRSNDSGFCVKEIYMSLSCLRAIKRLPPSLPHHTTSIQFSIYLALHNTLASASAAL
jgi:hypothetical protein